MDSSSSSPSREMEEGIVSVDAADKSSTPSSCVAAAGSVPPDLPEEASATHEGDQDSSSTDQHMVVKGKRTKRPRTTSPDAPQQKHQSAAAAFSSSGGVTEEEEDMANCLILLAQGDPHAVPVNNTIRHEDQGGGTGNCKATGSRRFTEASVSAAGPAVKAGFYVYECKTCSKCFPTFQALGGHRASHKKPKMTGVFEPSNYAAAAAAHTDSQEKPSPLDQVLIDHHHQTPRQSSLSDSPPPAAAITSILNNNNSGSKSTTARVHECSICGSEFQSGQALGGHMRRHRAASVTPSTPLPQLSADNPPSNPAQVVLMKSVVFPLDLNLPAPSEDAEFPKPPPPAFSFSAPTKRPPILLSTSPLVDCHY